MEIDYHLRRLARNYLAMDTEPDSNSLWSDISQCDYAEPKTRVRIDHGGVYAPLPDNVYRFSISEVARLVADEYIRNRRESLLRSDWQHIGFAVRLDPVMPPTPPTVPSIMSEYVIAWRLPPDVERPTNLSPAN